jgi:hypothetical protein
MRPLLTLLAVTAALAAAPAASAHPGGIWYTTPAKAARGLEGKFAASVSAARCWPLPASDRYRYDADSFVRGGARLWDHVLCALAIRGGPVCFGVAHVTGREWHRIVLTTYRYRGCTPYQLRR